MFSVLIIDDDRMMADMLARKIRRVGHAADMVHDIASGRETARKGSYDVIFLDVDLPDGNGLDLIPELTRLKSQPETIIITGDGDPDGAELAINNGAWDYVEKTSSLSAMILPLTRALQYREEKRAHRPTVALDREGIVGDSPALKACLDQVAQAAKVDANVLITGATGTGKELFARALHRNSERAEENFVVVDCAALPGNLIESVLFGHMRGAFTGADKDRDGLIKQADKGTLFLDEVGELPMELQKAFLRVLQDRRFRPVGGSKEISSDFRLIAATNRDLEELVQKGLFRADLLYRLRTFHLDLPPLKDRVQDISPLVLYHTSRICTKYGIGPKGFSPEFLDILTKHHWPGNVRELLHTLENTVAAALHEQTLYPQHLPTAFRADQARRSVKGPIDRRAPDPEQEKSADIRLFASLPNHLPSYKDMREQVLNEMEAAYLTRLLAVCDGDIKEACDMSKLSRSRLYDLLKKHNLTNS